MSVVSCLHAVLARVLFAARFARVTWALSIGISLFLGVQAGELDNLFDFDQDDVEFDEKELEQVWRFMLLFNLLLVVALLAQPEHCLVSCCSSRQLKMLSQGGDLNFLDPDDIELGVSRQDTVRARLLWLCPLPLSLGVTVTLRL